MSILDLHEDEMLGAAEAAPQVAPRRQEPKFSAWGVLKAAGGGVPAGVAESGASGIDLLSGLSKVDVSPQAMRDSQNEEGRKRIQKQAQETLETGFRSDAGRSLRNVAADYLPDPLTAHAAEVVVGDFSRVATKAVTAGVTLGPVLGAVVTGAEEGFTASDKLAEQGVDVATRSKVGAVTGAVTAAGFALPVAGKTIAGTVGLAAAGGPVSFVAQQAATREILQNADYDALADQYDPFDPVGLTLSTLIPLGFGAAARRSTARAAKADQATVEAARVNLLRETVETARPAPVEGMETSGAHEAAYTKAMDQMADGQRVDVTDVAQRDLTPAVRQFADQIDAELIRPRIEQVPRDASLPAADRVIETRLATKVTENFDAAAVEYAGRPDAMGGKVLNTDVARELSPEYLADRTKSAAVHEPSSYFIKRLYEQRLAEIKPGEAVLFTSGGTGAGKTTAISNVPGARAMFDDASIVYDTNMNKLATAVKKIEQALKAGAEVQIMHVQRDPVEALVNGALPRAARQAKEFGTGRTVPLKAHADTHRGAAEVIQQLAEKYKDDPRVLIQVLDNTRGKDGTTPSTLDFVKGFDYNGLERRLYEALKQQYDAGAIPESVFRATAGDAAPGTGSVLRAGSGEQYQPGGAGAGRQGPAGAASGEGASLTPEVQGAIDALGIPKEVSQPLVDAAADALRPAEPTPDFLTREVDTLVTSRPDMLVQLEGMDAPRPIAEVMAMVRQEAARDLEDAPLVQAAAECAIRNL